MKKLAFVLELENGAKLVSDISDVELRYKALSKEIRSTEKAIDTLNNGTKEQKTALEAEGVTLEKLETKYKVLKAEQIDLSKTKKEINADIRDQIKLFDSLGNKVPDDSLIGLRRTYRNLRKEIDNMDSTARRSVEGLKKIEEAKGIKTQINEIGKSVGDFREQVGSYEEAVTSVFEKFGIGKNSGGIGQIIDPIANIISGGGGDGGVLSDEFLSGGPIGQLTTALGPGGLIATAGAATLIATAGYVSDITQEFEILFGKVNQVNGVTGRALVESTAQIKAISDTYQVEFDDVLKAANATSRAFNTDIRDTLDLIQAGLGAGADLNGEYLDSLREYPRLVKEAGLTQEQFNEILIRSTQEGIYSDKGIDTVKEGNIRLREQTKATQKALQDTFGETFTEDLLGRVNQGTTTTFEAMQEISSELEDLQPTAQQTGAILADVFGGPGEDAGIEFIKTLKDVDGNLEDVIDTTNVYYRIQQNQIEANNALALSQANIASQFAGAGTNLRTLGTQAKTFGSEILDNLLLRVRAVGNEFEKGGFQRGVLQLGATLGGQGLLTTPGELLLRQQDADALAELNREQAKEQDRVTEANKRGANGVAGLREEQQKLSIQIQDAKAKGEPYKELLIDYEQVTLKLTSATDVLGKSIKRTKEEAQGEVGSLVRLRSELSAIQKEINEGGEVSEADGERLRQKEQEVADATKKINDITLKGRQKLIEDEINLITDGNALSATLTIDDQKELQETLKNIKIQGDIDILESRLKLERENSKEFEKIQLELAEKRTALSQSDEKISFINREQILDEATQVATEIADKISESEEELQLRVSNIQKIANNNRIQFRLDNEELTNGQRLELEREFQDNLNAIKENDSQLLANDRLDETNDELNRKIAQLAREAESIEEFEERKTEIILNAELERLEIEKERRITNGEDLLDVEREIAEKQLAINDEKNKGILDAQKKRIEEQKKFEKQLVDVQVGTLQGLGEAFGAFFIQSGEDQKDFAQSALLVVLDSVDKIINLYLAQILAKEIASKSFAGIATAALLGGVVKGALGAARAAISQNEEGDILMPVHKNGTIVRDISSLRSHTRDDLKRGTIFQGYSHASIGEPFSVGGRINEAEYGEAIINKRSTQRFKPLLSYINSYQGWGKKFQDGALLGNEQSNVVPINDSIVGSGGITREQMILFANIVASSQEDSLTPLIDSIVDRVITGLDENQRLKDRFSNVQKTA